jgi:histidine kinase
MNLVDNAIKYTDKGTVEISFEISDNVARCKIKDNGLGISLEELPHLFTRFMRTKEAQLVQTEGTGLGLYVAKTIIEAQSGKIWAESAGIGKGSTFVFELPVAPAGFIAEELKVMPRDQYAN